MPHCGLSEASPWHQPVTARTAAQEELTRVLQLSRSGYSGYPRGRLSVLRTLPHPRSLTMKRHNANSIAGTVLLLGCGAALTVISRRWGIGADLMSQLAGLLGPVGLALGLGMAIHGRAMPVDRISTLARVWGIAGSLAAVLNLWLSGYFMRGGAAGKAVRWALPLVLVVAWLLPGRFYGDTEHPTETALGD